MKTCKRLFAVVLAVVMAVSLLPLNIAFAADNFTISTMAELKAVLEGLRVSNGDNYPAGGTYVLSNDIDPVIDWILESDENSTKAAEDLGIETPVPASYRPATADDLTDDTVVLYEFDGEEYVTFVGDMPTEPDGFYVEVPASSTYGPLTPEQVSNLTAAQRNTVRAANNIENVTITPVKVDFSGMFDGNGKTISGMTISGSGTEGTQIAAMITDFTDEAVIKDLTLDESCVIELNSTATDLIEVGSIVGSSDGTIQNITSNATIVVTGSLPYFAHIGGIAGSSLHDTSVVENCTFGGTITYAVSADTFSDTSTLKTKDSSFLTIGGIVGYSETEVTGSTFSGTIDCNFIGGGNESINSICVGTESGGDDLTTNLLLSDKKVGSKDDETYFTTGTITNGEPNDDNYQLITKTEDDKDTFYIRQILCAHANPLHYDGVPATCGETGLHEYWFCEDCEKYFIIDPTDNPTVSAANYDRDVVLAKDPTNHTSSTHHDALDATCSKTGNVEYWQCDGCSKYFLEDPVLNHDAESKKFNQDIAVAKNSTHVSAKHIEATDPTCTKDGNKEYWQCNGCKKYFLTDPTTDPSASAVSLSATKIAKTGHSYGEWTKKDEKQHHQVCSVCGAEKTANHSFKKVVTPPTAEAQGYTTYTCKTCGYSYKDDYKDPLVSEIEVKSGSGYEKNSGYLITSLPKTKSGITVSDFKANLKTKDVTIRDENGKEVTSGNIKTGYTVEVKGQPKTKLIIAVKGDPNKDGKVSALDYVRVKNHILKKLNLNKDKAAFYAADANGDGKISALDYVKIKNLILKG